MNRALRSCNEIRWILPIKVLPLPLESFKSTIWGLLSKSHFMRLAYFQKNLCFLTPVSKSVVYFRLGGLNEMWRYLNKVLCYADSSGRKSVCSFKKTNKNGGPLKAWKTTYLGACLCTATFTSKRKSYWIKVISLNFTAQPFKNSFSPSQWITTAHESRKFSPSCSSIEESLYI